MKTVLVIASTFPRWENDSTPNFVYELSNRLAKGRKMVVLAPHDYNAAKYEKLGNIEIYRFQYFIPSKLQKVAYGAGIIPNIKNSFLAKLQVPLFLLSEFFAAKRLIKKYKPNILHAHWIIPHGAFAAIFKKIYKIPLVITIHGSDIFPLKNIIFRHFQRFALSSCDVCTITSMATKNEVMTRFPGFGNKLNVIPMGVDIRLFSSKNIKPKYRKYHKNKIILFVGRLNEQKGVDYLIKAIPAIEEKVPNTMLLIIGEGSYKADLEKLASALKVSNYLEFLGAMPHENIVNFYNLADVLVLPSVTSNIGTEGLGLVLLEAMSCGTCVIGTSTGGIKTIIKHNENGMLAKERDEADLAGKIIKVITDEKLRKKLSRNGAKFVRESYSWDAVAKKFERIYGNIK